MNRIIKDDRSIIPSCDVATLEELRKLVEATCDIDGIGAYKIGFELAIPFGMKAVVEEIRKLTKKPIIYDHQKAATDVPFTGEKFCRACADSGVDAVIFFPLSGPVTMAQWIKAAKHYRLGIIIGGEMTHESFTQNDQGWLINDAPNQIYSLAAKLGINEFVVPGNKPDRIRQYKALIQAAGVKEPIFWSPGLISQGGNVEEAAEAAGKHWHAIVGRALYQAKDIRKAAEKLVQALK